MDKSLAILQHTIGADEFGRIRGDRNYFVTGEGSTDYPTCVSLVERGLMSRRAGSAITGGDDWFSVTPAGKEFVAANSRVPKKLTPAQVRYQRYLADDCDESFGAWLVRDSNRRMELA